MVIFLFVIGFIGLLLAFAAAGRAADSRDSADWTPTEDGFRRPRPL